MQRHTHPFPGHQGHATAGALPSPQVEVVTQAGAGVGAMREPWYRARRLRLFVLVFLSVLVPGLIWDFSRPPVYQATASVLTVKPPPSAVTGAPTMEDVQHVAIQRQILLGQDLLEETVRLVAERSDILVESADALEPMLDVVSLPGTNLVELKAQGSEPELLAVVVNSWIDGYLNLRQRVLEEEVGERRRALEVELETITAGLESRRTEIDTFRGEHDIVTLERDGNEALARLSALTADLNRARNESVAAVAREESIREAMGRGDPVVPPGDEANLELLENRASELRARLIELEKRFTPMYLDNEPDLRVIPALLRKLEEEIAEKRGRGAEVMLALAAREVEETGRRVEVLEAELEEQKLVATQFTSDFNRYQSMQEEFAKLEEMQQDLQSQLVELVFKGLEKYPAVEVIEAAHPPAWPTDPSYWRDAGFVLLAALAAGLCAIFLLEFLTRRPREEVPQAPVTGVRVFPGAAPAAPALGGGVGYPPALGQDQPAGIPDVGRPGLLSSAKEAGTRELIAAEVDALWGLADPMSRELIALLLSGLTLDECAGLSPDHFDLEAATVRPAGEDGREVALAGVARELFAACQPLPIWFAGASHLSAAELDARLSLLAHDAGVSQPEEVDAEALRHTYVAFLVRQGARLTELERIIGPTPPSRLTAYAALTPAGAAKSLDDLDLVYPVLRAQAAV